MPGLSLGLAWALPGHILCSGTVKSLNRFDCGQLKEQRGIMGVEVPCGCGKERLTPRNAVVILGNAQHSSPAKAEVA
ncbi:hypothetical protein NDU88_004465 [Pleurodeles waltl]|uniref:Secreted protein n=1 Tax=Pleurodeles waltl TaxID=8319 RepID=A0AAV7MBS8_PLEWA|nr:hypothetical protein NDU88_004465 [Pleurodeles waltl]